MNTLFLVADGGTRPSTTKAEFATLAGDAFQRRGVEVRFSCVNNGGRT